MNNCWPSFPSVLIQLCHKSFLDRQTENKNSTVAIRRLTISEAVILAVITEVFRGRQEVFLYGRDWTIGVIIYPMACCSALLKLSLLPPLQTNKELVDIKDDAAGLGGASLPWTLNQAHTCTPLLLMPTLNGTSTDTCYACTNTQTVDNTYAESHILRWMIINILHLQTEFIV